MWAYLNTPLRAMNKMSYSLAFDFEVVIPLGVNLPIIRTKAYDDNNNSEVLAWDLDLFDKRRENVLIRMANYQKQLTKSYNQKVQHREFVVDDLISRKVVGNTKDQTNKKLGSN